MKRNQHLSPEGPKQRIRLVCPVHSTPTLLDLNFYPALSLQEAAGAVLLLFLCLANRLQNLGGKGSK